MAKFRFAGRSGAGQPPGIRRQPASRVWVRARAWLAGTAMAGLASFVVHARAQWVPAVAAPTEIALPPPRPQGRLSFEGALVQRRSLRSFTATPLTAAEAGQLLWAAQGITGEQGRRTAPSAGATYPLVLYLVAGRIDGVATGMHRYLPQGHRLLALDRRDLRPAIAAAARQQTWMQGAPALVLIAAQPVRTAARYGARADRYVAIETGAVAQNLLLQAVALGLGGTLVGAMDEAALRRVVSLPDGEQVMAIVPLGRPHGND